MDEHSQIVRRLQKPGDIGAWLHLAPVVCAAYVLVLIPHNIARHAGQPSLFCLLHHGPPKFRLVPRVVHAAAHPQPALAVQDQAARIV